MHPLAFWIVPITLLILLLWIGVGAFFTDPYFPWTTVKSPYATEVSADGNVSLKEVHPPRFTTSLFARLTAYARAGARIVIYRWIPEPALGTNEQTVLQQLHLRRFDPSKPYVITGAHYSDLYVRNLGVFFNELTSSNLHRMQRDTLLRQRMALQTVALDLAFLRANGRLVTTIVPLGGTTFTGVNIYAEPSDSLHAVLFTLHKLHQSPATQQAATQLLNEYRSELNAELDRYLKTVIDPDTKLVKRSIHLSGARDGVKREAAFYDTVVAWKTAQLARDLELLVPEWTAAESWKSAIISAYWLPDQKIFANDLSQNGKVFGADTLMAVSTGFLDPQSSEDLRKIQVMIDEIHGQQLDQPFPLRYSRTNSQNQLHWAVRLFASGYMGEGIWSHWGIEYIKALLVLGDSPLPNRCEYLQRAQQFLRHYQAQIEKTGGYPELYGPDGTSFSTPAVKAVLHSGWVVNYEAASARLKTLLMTTSCEF